MTMESLQKQLAEEQVARMEAEKRALEFHEKLLNEIRNLILKMETTNQEIEVLRGQVSIFLLYQVFMLQFEVKIDSFSSNVQLHLTNLYLVSLHVYSSISALYALFNWYIEVLAYFIRQWLIGGGMLYLY